MDADPNMVDEMSSETATDPKKEQQNAPEADGQKSAPSRSLDAIFGVKLEVRVVLGKSKLPISEILDLSKGSVIELDRKVGDPVEIMVNDRMVARGDLVKVEGDQIGVALREIVKHFVAE